MTGGSPQAEGGRRRSSAAGRRQASGDAAFHGTVSGRVQAVGFRWSTAREASRLGIAGWVRNLPDGRVEVFIQGKAAPIDDMREFLRSGPPAAIVDAVELEAVDTDPRLSRFDIR